MDPGIQNEGRAAFLKLHEVGHDTLPWQRALGYADDDATLAPSVKRLFEQEANIAASHLLFQQDYFDDVSRQYSIGHALYHGISLAVSRTHADGVMQTCKSLR